MTFALQGIVAAPFLPMQPDTEIDWRTLERYIAAGSPDSDAFEQGVQLARGLLQPGPQLPPQHVSEGAEARIGGPPPLLLLLAVALMEATGIHVKVCDDPSYSDVEGFVLGGQDKAIIAN